MIRTTTRAKSLYCYLYLVATTIVIVIISPTFASDSTIAAGVQFRTVLVPDDGKLFVVVLGNNNETNATARVISSSSTNNAKKYGFEVASSMTLSDYYFSTGAIAAVSGGFIASFSPPVPLGAIFVDGRQVSLEISTWLGTGMFCDSKNKYYVGLYDSGKAHLFADCIQAGPLFIQGGNLRYDSEVNNQGELALVRRFKRNHLFAPQKMVS
jgi:hypothetical protein